MTVASHRADAVQLTSEGYVHLYKLLLRQGTAIVCFSPDPVLYWQGNKYESIPCELTGVGSYADEQQARPKFNCHNPDGAFTGIIAQGALESARLTRYRLLRSHAEQNQNIFTSKTWRVARVTSLNKFAFSLELRDISDRANYVIPSETYSPPKYPSVSVR